MVEMGRAATSLALTPAADEPRVLTLGGEVLLRESTPAV
jgi:hypothetical protein